MGNCRADAIGVLISKLDHPGRDIERLDLDSPVAKKDRVQPGSAIQFKDVMARFEDSLELLPDRMTAYLPYRRSGEPMLVASPPPRPRSWLWV